MRVLIENSKLIYRKDSVFKPLFNLTQIGKKQISFQRYSGKEVIGFEGKIFLYGKQIIIEDSSKQQISKATIKTKEILIKVNNKTFIFHKGKEQAYLYKDKEQIASIWLNLPNSELIDITINHHLPFEELTLIIVAIINLKTGFFFKKSILEKLETSDKFDAIGQWRPAKLSDAERELEFKEEFDRFLAIDHPSKMLFADRILNFPWLQDTLQYWGERPIEMKEKCMSNLLLLLSMVEGKYDHRTCNGYAYCLSSYKAGLYIYSPDGYWNYEPIGQSLEKTSDIPTIIDLISILEDALDSYLYTKYIDPLKNHESLDIRTIVKEAKERMR